MVLWFLLKSFWAFGKLSMNIKDTGNFCFPEQEPPEIGSSVAEASGIGCHADMESQLYGWYPISWIHVLSLSPAL